MRYSAIALLLAGLVVAAGCGDSETASYPKTVPVTGVVTQGDKPVEGAVVQFVGRDEGSYSATGLSGPDGSYSVSTYFSPSLTADGAVPGTYRITVKKSPPAAPTDPAAHDAAPAATGPTNLLPNQYANAATTPLTATVQEGRANEIPVELE